MFPLRPTHVVVAVELQVVGVPGEHLLVQIRESVDGTDRCERPRNLLAIEIINTRGISMYYGVRSVVIEN